MENKKFALSLFSILVIIDKITKCVTTRNRVFIIIKDAQI